MNNINFENLRNEILATQEDILKRKFFINFDYNAHCIGNITGNGVTLCYVVCRKQGSKDLLLDLEIDLKEKKVLSSKRRHQKGEDFYNMELSYPEAVEIFSNLYEAHSK